MSVLNVSARPYALTIAGLDCLTALVSADGAFQHYDQSGLALINATFILKRPFHWTESLDDRTNPRWARGQLVQTMVANSGGTPQAAPILGHLYILNSEFDGINELKIECGCILNLLMYRTPAGEGACFNLGEETNLTAIAQKLLRKAGAPPLIGSIIGNPLKVPLRKITNESYIGLFGKLCWANGHIAWQDNLGRIRARQTLSGAMRQTPEVGLDDVRYQRLTGVEVPPEKIRVTGTLQSLKKVEDENSWKEKEYGPAAMVYGSVAEVAQDSGLNPFANVIIRETTYRESLDRPSRIKRTETKVRQPRGLALPDIFVNDLFLRNDRIMTEFRREKYIYEWQEQKPEDECKEIDEGRLLKTSYVIRKPDILGLQRWYSQDEGRLEVARQQRPFLETIDMTAETGETEYFYYDNPEEDEDNPNEDDSGGGGVPGIPGEVEVDDQEQGIPVVVLKIVSEKKLPIGEILPQANWALPKQLRTCERQIRKWKLIRKGEWEYTESNYQSFALYQPDLVERLIDEGDSGNASNESYWMSFVNLVPTERRVDRSNSGQSTPPAPERFPIEYEVKEKNVSVTVRLPGLSFGYLFRDREREFTVDSGLLTSKEQARMIARIEGAILWGRYKGQSCTVAVSDAMFPVEPLDLAQWKDFYGSRHTFWMDGISLAMTQTRVLLAYDGIWKGSIVTINGVDVTVKPFQEEVEAIVSGAAMAQFTVLPQVDYPTPDIAVEIAGAGAVAVTVAVAEAGYLVDEAGGYVLDEAGDRFILGFF